MNFDSFKYWENRYLTPENFQNYEGNFKKKAVWINKFIKKNNIKRMFDYGCGDGRQANLFEVDNYLGVDISATAIGKCQERASGKKFYLAQKNDKKLTGLIKKFNPDFALSSWTISHLIKDELFIEYMNNLFLAKFVVINSLNQDTKYSALYQKDRHFTEYIKNNFPEWQLKEQDNTYIYENDIIQQGI